jgi:hypothetical protein
VQPFRFTILLAVTLAACGGHTTGTEGAGGVRGGSGEAGVPSGGTGGISGTGLSCVLDSDCPNQLVCINRFCHEQCAEGRDCAAGESCIDVMAVKICQLLSESHCVFNSECVLPLVCAIDQQCRNQCMLDRDCGGTAVCAKSKVCAPPELLDASGDLSPP